MNRRHFLFAGLAGVAGCSGEVSTKQTPARTEATQFDGNSTNSRAMAGGGGEPPRPIGAPRISISQVAFLPDDKRVLTRSSDRITLWHLDKSYKYPTRYFEPAEPGLGTTDFFTFTGNFDVSRDGKRLLATDRGGLLRVWDIDSRRAIVQTTRIPSPRFGSGTIAVSSDDRLIAIGGGAGHTQRQAEATYGVIDEQGTRDNRALAVWDRKEKKYQYIADFVDLRDY